MIIRFHNLGKIKETELDLRPMTVIIGPNNSNKTYIAYSVYGLWKAQQRRFRSSLRFKVERKLDSSPKDEQADSPREIEFLVSVNPSFLEHISTRIQDIATNFGSQLDAYFQDTSSRLFKSTSYEMQLSKQDILDKLSQASEYRFAIRQKDTRYSYTVSYIQEKILVRWMYSRADNINNEDESGYDSYEQLAQQIASIAVTSFLFNTLFSLPFLLPAERNAFIITYKMLVTRRYKFMRDTHRQRRTDTQIALENVDLEQEEEPVRYPQPVEDFLDFLTDIETAPMRLQTKSVKDFSHVADMIEDSIQGGNKTRYRPTALGGNEIVIGVEEGMDIDLYNASSSIKQLAPLLIYLRYRARKNDLLIIDEPEMNLHPESQVKLLEALALLVNMGINVLVTTHSPYIMAHLNNLALGKENTQATKKRQASSLYLKNPNSFLNMEQISAYEMRDNKLHSLKESDYGIRWNTLSDVSVDLQQKYFEIYEAGYEKTKTKRTPRTKG